MTDIGFKCPLCGQSLDAPNEMAGQTLDCPACKKTITVPQTVRAQQSPSSTQLLPKIEPLSPPSKRGRDMTASQEPPKKRTSVAIVSLVCGIIGGWASTLSIPAVICGHMALGRIKREPTNYGGKRIAIAGLVLGYLGLTLAIVHGALKGALRAELLNLPRSLIEQNGATKLTGPQSQATPPVVLNEGAQPYIPSRLEWLALELTADSRVEYTKSTPFSLGFCAVDKNNAIRIIGNYYSDINSDDKQFMDQSIMAAHRAIMQRAEAYGWASWIKVEESIQMLRKNTDLLWSP